MFEVISTSDLILATLVVVVASAIQGSVGIGYAITTAPLLRLIVPEAVPVAVMVSVTLVALLSIVRERSSLGLSGAGWVIVGRIPGAVVGALLLARLPATVLDVSIAVMVLVAVAAMTRGASVPFNRATQFGAGLISGTTATATSIGGPPLAMLYRERSGPEIRSTLAAIFLIGIAISLSTLGLSGQLERDDVAIGILLMPGGTIGFLISSRLRQVIDGELLRKLLLVICSIAALWLLVSAVA